MLKTMQYFDIKKGILTMYTSQFMTDFKTTPKRK